MSAHHNYVIVDGDNKTLWVRAVAACTPQVVLEALRLTRESVTPGNPCFVAESLEDSVTGKEVSFRLAQPYLEAKAAGSTAPGRVLEVWHVSDFASLSLEERFAKSAPAHLDRGQFTRVMEFLAGGEVPVERALSMAFELSQNIDHSWRPGEGARSTSVGDVIVVRQGDSTQAWRVMPFGFASVENFSETP